MLNQARKYLKLIVAWEAVKLQRETSYLVKLLEITEIEQRQAQLT
ncbi:hypothetical protein [Microcoleus sp. K4-B3]